MPFDTPTANSQLLTLFSVRVLSVVIFYSHPGLPAFMPFWITGYRYVTGRADFQYAAVYYSSSV